MKPWFEIVKESDHELGVEVLRKPKRLTNKRRIEMSIEKYEAFLEAVDKNTTNIYSRGISCPLCWEHSRCYCVDCPVFKKTGADYCDNTPYYDIVLARTPETIRAALRKEIKFLESLLGG